MCIRGYLKETILWSSITWSEMGKQNIQAEKVYSSFVELRPTLFFLVASSMLMDACSCSCCVELAMIMSSAMPVTLGMSLYTSSSLRWKMSCDTLTPMGRRLNLYLRSGVLKVQSGLDSSLSSVYQYPLLVSTTEKYFHPCI